MKNDLPPACILEKALTINCKSTLPGLSSVPFRRIMTPMHAADVASCETYSILLQQLIAIAIYSYHDS